MQRKAPMVLLILANHDAERRDGIASHMCWIVIGMPPSL